jgi:hypothetical protein
VGVPENFGPASYADAFGIAGAGTGERADGKNRCDLFRPPAGAAANGFFGQEPIAGGVGVGVVPPADGVVGAGSFGAGASAAGFTASRMRRYISP